MGLGLASASLTQSAPTRSTNENAWPSSSATPCFNEWGMQQTWRMKLLTSNHWEILCQAPYCPFWIWCQTFVTGCTLLAHIALGRSPCKQSQSTMGHGKEKSTQAMQSIDMIFLEDEVPLNICEYTSSKSSLNTAQFVLQEVHPFWIHSALASLNDRHCSKGGWAGRGNWKIKFCLLMK